MILLAQKKCEEANCMSVKKIIVLSLILALFSAPFLFSQGDQEAAGEKTYTLKLGHVLNTDHMNHKVSLRFAELVQEKTDGQVKVEVYPASQLGSGNELIDGIAMGTIDFAIEGFGPVAPRFSPGLIFDAPYVFKDREHLSRVYETEFFADLMGEMEEDAGIVMVSPGYYGTRHLTTTDTIVESPEDLKGMKIRCPDQPMYVGAVKALGASPTPIAFSETYLALQQGAADGQENPAAAIISMKFNEVQDYLMKTAHIVQGNHIFGSAKALNKLPEDLKQAVLDSGAEVSGWWIQESFKVEDELLATLDEEGMTILEPDVAPFVEQASPLYEEYESKWGEGLLESIRAID